VRRNLQNSFPEKDLKAIKQIEKKFYRNFVDVFFEILKAMSISKDYITKHVRVKNPELLEKYLDQGKSLLVVTSHSGNWEWIGNQIGFSSKHHNFGVYKRLRNPYFEEFTKKHRERFGQLKTIEMNQVLRTLVRLKNQSNLVYMVADQSPRGAESDYWTIFLNQETAFFRGMAKMAKALDYAVIYAESHRVRRGHYEVVLQEIVSDSKSISEDEIIERYARYLETFIRQYADNWLWSHRRWKHKRKGLS
jgi:KDO2-lipid IV(A) lauroyltransferase